MSARAIVGSALDDGIQHTRTHHLVGPGTAKFEVRDALVRLLSLLGEGQSVTLGTVSELLTTSQAAEILGVSDTCVRRLADAGTLPTEMRGTHRRFRLSDVTAYR